MHTGTQNNFLLMGPNGYFTDAKEAATCQGHSNAPSETRKKMASE